MASFNEVAFAERLRRIDNTQQSITGLSKYMAMAGGGARAGTMVKLWLAELESSPSPDHMLALIYLVNDVLQGVRRSASSFPAQFARVLPAAMATIGTRGLAHVSKVQRVVRIWRDRSVLPAPACDALLGVLDDPDSAAEVVIAVDAAGSSLLSANDAADTSPMAQTASAVGGGDTPADAEPGDSEQPRSPISFLETALLPLVANGGKAPAPALDAAATATLLSELSDTSIARAETALVAVDRAEVSSSLSADEAAALVGAAQAAFCVEDTLAANNAAATATLDGEGKEGRAATTKAELLAQSLPFDAPAALVLLSRHLALLQSESEARTALLKLLQGELLPAMRAATANDRTTVAAEEETLREIIAARNGPPAAAAAVTAAAGTGERTAPHTTSYVNAEQPSAASQFTTRDGSTTGAAAIAAHAAEMEAALAQQRLEQQRLEQLRQHQQQLQLQDQSALQAQARDILGSMLGGAVPYSGSAGSVFTGAGLGGVFGGATDAQLRGQFDPRFMPPTSQPPQMLANQQYANQLQAQLEALTRQHAAEQLQLPIPQQPMLQQPMLQHQMLQHQQMLLIQQQQQQPRPTPLPTAGGWGAVAAAGGGAGGITMPGGRGAVAGPAGFGSGGAPSMRGGRGRGGGGVRPIAAGRGVANTLPAWMTRQS